MTFNEPQYRASTFKVETSPSIWRQALASLSKAHALQSWAWGAFKSRWDWSTTRYTMTVAENSRNPLASAQVLKRKVPRLPFSILYVPKGPALDYYDKALRRRVLAELEKIARREKAIFIKIDPEIVRYWGVEKERPNPIGAQFIKDLQTRGWRYSDDQIQFCNTVEMDLTRSEEDLLAAMKPKTRYNIRLAERKGIAVRAGGPADFPLIAAMYTETAVRDNFTIRPTEYYLDAWQTLYDADMCQPLIAEFEGTAVAAVVLIRFGEKTIYMYGASTHLERQRMPNYLLQWEAIRWAKAQGCTTYDFWGAPNTFDETDSLWGVWRFKAGFNADVVHYIGAWDYVVQPFWYWVYTSVIPKYLEFLRSKNNN